MGRDTGTGPQPAGVCSLATFRKGEMRSLAEAEETLRVIAGQRLDMMD